MHFIKNYILVVLLSVINLSSIFCQQSATYSIFFKRGKYNLDERGKLNLNNLALKCKADTAARIRIFGFSDTYGSSEHNDELSKKRTYAVYNFLINKARIKKSQIIYMMWIGESDDTYDFHITKPHAQENCVDIYAQFYSRKK